MIPGVMQFQQEQPVVCLGREFPSDEACREYFREELRKKLPYKVPASSNNEK